LRKRLQRQHQSITNLGEMALFINLSPSISFFKLNSFLMGSSFEQLCFVRISKALRIDLTSSDWSKFNFLTQTTVSIKAKLS
jgi:hypothetical protein